MMYGALAIFTVFQPPVHLSRGARPGADRDVVVGVALVSTHVPSQEAHGAAAGIGFRSLTEFQPTCT